MSDPSSLRALYYPFAHPRKDTTLKRAVLLFDQVWFVDLSNQRLREGGRWAEDVPPEVLQEWEKVRQENALLLEREVAILVDPEPLVQENDRLLAAAFKADLMDNDVWRLFTTPGTPDTMVLLRRKVPASAFEFLNSQTYGRINYGTARAKAFFHKTYMDWPNLSGERFEEGSNPFPSSFEDAWLRFLFHDGMIAREMNTWYYKDMQQKSEYMDVEFTCVFPFTHASSLLVNQAMLLASKFDLILFCDNPMHQQLLDLKRRRIARPGSDRKEPESLQYIAVPSMAPLLPGLLLDRLDLERTLQYRERLQEALRPWKASVSTLHSLSETRNAGDESEMSRLIETKVVTEAQRASEQAIIVYERLFGPIGAFAPQAPSGTAVAGEIFSGLSIPEMLVYASTGALGAEPEEFLKPHLRTETERQRVFLSLAELEQQT